MTQAPIEKIIKAAVDRGASDLHIKAGDIFRARIDGKLVPLTRQRLTPAQTRAIAARLVPLEEERGRLDQLRDFDCSWGLPGVGRFRVNVLRQRSSFMIVMRVIPFSVPTLGELGLPDVLGTLAESRAGLVLVAGASGSGRSSTIAAMLDHLNQTVERHVVTIENPIEFLHRDLKSSVTQREVGVDTESVAVALRAVLRQDPDVVVVGDIRDADSLDATIRAAETGVLVIGALTAPDVVSALDRAFAMLPEEDREIARLRLADSIRGVVAQRLVPRDSGDGRVAVVEVLVATDEVRACLRDPDRLGELRALMESGAEGMRTYDQHLAELAGDGTVEGGGAGPSSRRGSRRRR